MAIFEALSAIASIGGTMMTNKANAREAQRNREFQERMSNTSMQRARKDMEAAGINPGVLGFGGAGASTPGGAVAQMANPLESAIGNVRETSRTVQELRNMKEQNRLIDAQREKTLVEGATAKIQGDLLTEQAREVAQRRVFDFSMQPMIKEKMRLDNEMNRLMLPTLQNEAKLQNKLGIGAAAIPFIVNSAKSLKGLIR